MSFREAEDQLIDEVAGYAYDPLGFARDLAFDWGNGPLEKEKGLRSWQIEMFDHVGKHLRDKKTRFQPCQIAVASGHGIGKSAWIGMFLNWAMSTQPDTKIIYTANTETQLRTKTTPEITKWNQLSITGHWFEATATALYAKEKKSQKTWRADAATWTANNTEAFAGLHNKGKRIIVIFDEASGIDDKVWEVTEGALTDEDTEIIWIAFGNPTQNSGRFRECFRKFKHRWFGMQIDSRKVEGTNKVQIEKWLEDHGENSDFFKIRVRGIFPKQSARQFISEEDVDKAFGKHLEKDKYEFAPKILTCDPAWEGGDELVIALRQGLAFKILEVIEKNDNDIVIANKLARWEDSEEADAVFVDGGYGTGIISGGRTLGREWMIVWFSGESDNEGCLNKRAEMWQSIKDWLKEGGAIPDDNGLRDELIGVQTVPRFDGKIQLESKKDMKARGLTSPNKADALALSFAYPVVKKPRDVYGKQTKAEHKVDYDPFAEI